MAEITIARVIQYAAPCPAMCSTTSEAICDEFATASNGNTRRHAELKGSKIKREQWRSYRRKQKAEKSCNSRCDGRHRRRSPHDGVHPSKQKTPFRPESAAQVRIFPSRFRNRCA